MSNTLEMCFPIDAWDDEEYTLEIVSYKTSESDLFPRGSVVTAQDSLEHYLSELDEFPWAYKGKAFVVVLERVGNTDSYRDWKVLSMNEDEKC